MPTQAISTNHWGFTRITIALCVLVYLIKTKEMGITYGRKLKIPTGLDAYPSNFHESLGLHTHHDS